MRDGLTVIIPAYCEAEALPRVLPRTLNYCRERGWAVIVVDDGSTDATPRVLQEFACDPQLTIARHKVNRGYGAAIKTGLRHAKTRYAVTFDADGQHQLESLDDLYRVMVDRDADLVVGRRQWQSAPNAYRTLGKFIIRLFANLLVPNSIQDLNSGCKLYRTAEVLKYLSFCPNSMAFSDVITLVMISRRCLVLEHPIQVAERQAGKSTVNTRTALETILEILHALILLKPMRFFFPLSSLSILAGVAWGLPIMLAGRGVSVGSMLAISSGLILFTLGLLSEQIARLRLVEDEAGCGPDEP